MCTWYVFLFAFLSNALVVILLFGGYCLSRRFVFLSVTAFSSFRNNAGSKCAGAGIRLGGWEEGGVQYGIDNDVS